MKGYLLQTQDTQQRIEELERKNAELLAELWEQWLDNHSERCSDEWPHLDGQLCCWPLPPTLMVTFPSKALQPPLGEEDGCD